MDCVTPHTAAPFINHLTPLRDPHKMYSPPPTIYMNTNLLLMKTAAQPELLLKSAYGNCILFTSFPATLNYSADTLNAHNV